VRLEAARALSAVGVPEAALPLLRRIDAGDETDPSVVAELLLAAARWGKDVALEVVSRRLSDESPEIARAAHHALVYCGAAGLETAEKSAAEVLAESPDDVDALLLRARVAARRGENEQALSYLQRLENVLARDEFGGGGLDGLDLEDSPLLAPLLYGTGN